MTPEEIAEMEESVPEWKRNALVIASDDEGDDLPKKRGYIGRMKGAIGEKLSETEAAQKFYESEEYKKIQDYRKEVNEFKEELREQVDNSHNPVVQVAN